MTEDRTLFEHLASMSEDMVFVTAMDSSATLWVNDALINATGYSFDDYRFGNFENPFIPPEDLEKVAAFLQEFLESGAPISGIVSNRFIDRWGGTLHVRSRIARVTWDGEPALLYRTSTEDRFGTQSLDAEARYRSLVEIATDAIVQLHEDLSIRYSNRAFQELVGRSPLELASVRFPALVADGERERCERDISTMQGTLSGTWQLDGKDGQAHWLEGTFVRIERGPDAGVIQAILRDVTERRALDERLRQAQKRETIAQLAAGVAHDLNNILTGILGSASLAGRSQKPDVISQSLADIGIAAERAGQLSSALLVYAGEGTTVRHTINWHALISEMQPLLSTALPRDVRLTIKVPETQVLIHAAENEVRQVVMNLITNAADSMAESGGDVVVEAGSAASAPRDCAGGTWVGTHPSTSSAAFVRVLDRGNGIAPEILSHMFDPFFSTKASGRGLGLSTVLGVVERHGGCITVKGRPGGGTAFEVWLPTLAEGRAVEHPPADDRDTPATAGTRVLVVDDEAMIRKVASRILESGGYEVVEAESGARALDELKKGTDIDIVVLDQTMPGMTGEQTLESMRQTHPDLPVLRTSGYATESMAMREKGPVAYLHKPYSAHTLLAAVSALLASSDGH